MQPLYRTRRVDPKTFVLFRKISKDSGGSVSWNRQTNWRASSKIATAPMSPSFFVFLLGWPSTCLCANEHQHRICIPILFHRFDIREDANSHKVIWCKYLSSNLCTAVERASQMDSGLWGSFFLDALLPLWVRGSEVERFLVSALHAYLHRDRNYTCLVSNTDLSLSIDSSLLVLFQHHVDPCDS